MDKCVLIKPDLSFENEIEAFRKEMIEANSSMDGTGPLKQMSDIKEWLKYSQCCGNKEYVPENWVTCEQYIYVRVADNKIVGMIQFRHYLNEFLEKYGGHIGYSVRPSERRKGYAKQMLAECLKACKAYGLKDILLTCNQENEGSKRTILANGGVYESTVYCESQDVYIERYWIHL